MGLTELSPRRAGSCDYLGGGWQTKMNPVMRLKHPALPPDCRLSPVEHGEKSFASDGKKER